MLCPYCSSELKKHASILTESEDRVITYFHQWWRCRKCGEHFYALLVEYQFDETLTHYGYRADKKIWGNDLKIIKKCKNSENPLCSCDVHNEINDIASHYSDVAWYSSSS